ncbi:MAG: FimV/HubP family polar landmark protein [Steroidobacteraceae bacterium]|nr:FimV family protein [Steroidobacteraceae bacterium]MBP7014521.1 FimV family protein [Steroidobacteraceae bacterium]
MKTAVRRVLLMSALLAPGALYALGLGEIKLKSALNQPFDAEIELVSATQEDLGALRAALASNDTFVRYGLDRPAYLADFNFRVAKGADGGDVLRVTSPRPVTEPFVTLLVEANWPRGRLLREYTVLLDPPVYAPGPAASEPVAVAPRVSSGGASSTRSAAPVADATSEAVRSPGPASSTVPAAAPAIEPGSTYRVRNHDTLWEIASAANPGPRANINRAMVAIFQDNPQAFDGNINVLRSGSLLRIPDASQISSVSASEASAEVARQYDAWRSGTGTAAASEAGRLRLVTPEQGTAAPSTATSTASAAATPPAPAGTPAVAASRDLETRVKQLENELAEARRLLEVRNAELATLQGGAPVPAGEAVEPGTTPTEPGATPAGAAPETAATAEPAAAEKPKKPKKTVVEPPQPSLLERVTEYWWVLLGLLAAGLGAWLIQRLRRERGSAEESLEEALGSRDTRGSGPRYAPRSRDTDILVEERGGIDTMGRGAAVAATAAAAASTARPPEPIRKVVTVEDTLSGDGPASMESGDPLAEADFHMAYGLYDQAADLVQLAMKREPQRRDLKLKLLEIFFVWGNKERFLDLARDLGTTRADAPAGEWDKVLIMGKQIAPGDALFAASPSSSASDSLDMELHGSTGTLDLTIPAGDSAGPDMDLTESETEIAPIDRSGIDFMLDEPARAKDDTGVLPTIEMPRISSAADTTGDTQEVTIDRLGLDLDTLRDLESLDADEASAARKRASSDTVETAMVGGGKEVFEDDNTDLLNSTALMRMVDDTAMLPGDESLESIVDLSGATGELPALDATGEMPVLDSTASTAILAGNVDYDLGGEPATMSEVGTKLDLARAYMDMGDPEGARSILDEVLQEGSSTQRQEAERLIASLP